MSFKDVNDSINKIMGSMMDLFFPRRCPFCGAIVGKELLCDGCKKTLPPMRSGAASGNLHEINLQGLFPTIAVICYL